MQSMVPSIYLASFSAIDFLFNTVPTTTTNSSSERDVTTTTGRVIAAMIPPFRAEESLCVGSGVTVNVTTVLSTVEVRSIGPPE